MIETIENSRIEFKKLKSRYWGQHLWLVGYFCRSVGTITKKQLKIILKIKRMKVKKILRL